MILKKAVSIIMTVSVAVTCLTSTVYAGKKEIFDYAVKGDVFVSLADARNAKEHAPKQPEGTYKLEETLSVDYNEIAEYIKQNIDEKFNIENFDIAKREFEAIDGFGAVSFRYKVGEFISDFGYNVFFQDDKVTDIVTIGEPLYDNTSVLLNTKSVSDTELKQMALDYYNTEDEVVSQGIERWYDSKENKPYYKVVTELKDKTDSYYCLVYTYEP